MEVIGNHSVGDRRFNHLGRPIAGRLAPRGNGGRALAQALHRQHHDTGSHEHEQDNLLGCIPANFHVLVCRPLRRSWIRKNSDG